MMRTTITLSDEAAALALTYANARSLRFSAAVSELIVKANQKVETSKSRNAKRVNGIRVFDIPKGARTISAEEVKAFLEDGL